ncbi:MULTISPECIES: DUF86 domain-containing protein [unclassified Alcanivorax]|uniref:HepT-like ribonuclease domain-containing protein n=1 Tax=unclassified Alcanivorax TaxID=2638842 RepID=UPI001E289FAA|nr:MULTISPECIES: DUF86 domain-containing protein [unclassified Alcanivorax]
MAVLPERHDRLCFESAVLHRRHGTRRVRGSALTYDATLRNLELIGEAATHIPDEIRASHPETPWRMIIATRNRLIHGYLGIDDDTLWSIIRDNIPELLSKLEAFTAGD